MGKFSKIRKIKRQCRELKASFPHASIRSIKEEFCPLILLKIIEIVNSKVN